MIQLGSELRTELKREIRDVQILLEENIEEEIKRMNNKIENIQVHSMSTTSKTGMQEGRTNREEKMRNREARKTKHNFF